MTAGQFPKDIAQLIMEFAQSHDNRVVWRSSPYKDEEGVALVMTGDHLLVVGQELGNNSTVRAETVALRHPHEVSSSVLTLPLRMLDVFGSNSDSNLVFHFRLVPGETKWRCQGVLHVRASGTNYVLLEPSPFPCRDWTCIPNVLQLALGSSVFWTADGMLGIVSVDAETGTVLGSRLLRDPVVPALSVLVVRSAIYLLTSVHLLVYDTGADTGWSLVTCVCSDEECFLAPLLREARPDQLGLRVRKSDRSVWRRVLQLHRPGPAPDLAHVLHTSCTRGAAETTPQLQNSRTSCTGGRGTVGCTTVCVRGTRKTGKSACGTIGCLSTPSEKGRDELCLWSDSKKSCSLQDLAGRRVDVLTQLPLSVHRAFRCVAEAGKERVLEDDLWSRTPR